MKFVLVLWIGFCLGATWQSLHKPAPPRPLGCDTVEIEAAYNSGYAWGLAECNGEDEP